MSRLTENEAKVTSVLACLDALPSRKKIKMRNSPLKDSQCSDDYNEEMLPTESNVVVVSLHDSNEYVMEVFRASCQFCQFVYKIVGYLGKRRELNADFGEGPFMFGVGAGLVCPDLSVQ